MSELGDGLNVGQKVGMAMSHIEKGAELLRLAAEEGALVLRHADMHAMVSAARADLDDRQHGVPADPGALDALLVHLEEALQR
jgi:predicted RecA/RadA family phage recombinase